MTLSLARALWRLAVFIVAAGIVVTAVALGGRLAVLGDLNRAPGADGGTLAGIAADIRPTIDVIERFRAMTGTYPARIGDLAAKLPAGVIADTAGDASISFDTGHGAVWVYERDDDGGSYELSRHLADGGSLTADCDHGSLSWSYAASDDDDPVPVALPSSN